MTRMGADLEPRMTQVNAEKVKRRKIETSLFAGKRGLVFWGSV